MKLPITDEFLWEIFHLSQKVTDVFHFLGFRSWKEVFVPPQFSLQRIYEKRKAKTEFKQFINYLVKKDLIKVKEEEIGSGVIITPKGMEKIFKVALQEIEKKKRKDGKLLMVVFDIPERKRKLRNAFRETLQILGFNFFQKSIWISSFDVLKEVRGVVKNLGLVKYVKIFLIKGIKA